MHDSHREVFGADVDDLDRSIGARCLRVDRIDFLFRDVSGRRRLRFSRLRGCGRRTQHDRDNQRAQQRLRHTLTPAAVERRPSSRQFGRVSIDASATARVVPAPRWLACSKVANHPEVVCEDLQDRWAVAPRITVTAGVRYDRQRPYYKASTLAPVLSDIFAATTIPGATLLERSTVAPRLGVSIDPTGDTKSAVKVFYGRYYNNLASDFANLNPGGAASRTYRFLDPNGNNLYDGPQELGALVASTGGTSTTLDPNLRVPR